MTMDEFYRAPEELECPVCEQPIHWCLDMFSFTIGMPHKLAHARCVWKPEAFRREERLSRVAEHA